MTSLVPYGRRHASCKLYGKPLYEMETGEVARSLLVNALQSDRAMAYPDADNR